MGGSMPPGRVTIQCNYRRALQSATVLYGLPLLAPDGILLVRQCPARGHIDFQVMRLLQGESLGGNVPLPPCSGTPGILAAQRSARGGNDGAGVFAGVPCAALSPSLAGKVM
eukprot:5989516-Amphidinium_carterae.1